MFDHFWIRAISLVFVIIAFMPNNEGCREHQIGINLVVEQSYNRPLLDELETRINVLEKGVKEAYQLLLPRIQQEVMPSHNGDLEGTDNGLYPLLTKFARCLEYSVEDE